MSQGEQDPRARFRQLPEPVRPADVVETSDANRPVVAETTLETDWRLSLLGPGTP
ncbi:MAG: hypothetical protein JWP68_3109 [Modestobacter sp.]|jgi:hypothetical protein|nr:hypothetical protein [Modestobacter sp.]